MTFRKPTIKRIIAETFNSYSEKYTLESYRIQGKSLNLLMKCMERQIHSIVKKNALPS